MSAISDTCSIVSSLVPMYSSAGSRTEERERVDEGQMCAIALLISALLLGTIEAVAQKNPKAFDANPGDGACQNQALELRRIFLLDLSEECADLKTRALDLKVRVLARKGSAKERMKLSSERFFRNHVETMRVSKEMEYLVHCFLLTVTRVVDKRLENGIVLTKTDPNQLCRLSKRLKCAQKVAACAQMSLSLLNMAVIRSHAQTLAPGAAKERTLRMLSPECTRMYTPSPRYPPKAIGPLFYEVHTVVSCLREDKALIALKSIETEEKPFYLLMQPDKSGEAFQILEKEALAGLEEHTLLVVFEAVVKGGRDAAAEEIAERGFTDLTLTCAAREAPLGPGSTLEMIACREAQNELLAYREKQTCLQLDHAYVTTLKMEGVHDGST